MKYSFLVPVYNVEKYLEDCVESILAQTFKDFEIILVDDGSTDSSGKICDRYAEQYPQKIRVIHKQNEGQTAARQTAIEAANGEICLFADSDDFVDEDLLESVDREFSADGNLDLVMYSFSYFENGEKKPRRRTIVDFDTTYTDDNKEILYSALINTPLVSSLWTKAVKTSLLKMDSTNHNEYFDKRMGEDWFKSIQIITGAQKIKYINHSFYNYRIDNVSISRSFSPATISCKNMLYIYNRFLEYLPLWNMDTAENKNKLKARWLNEVMYMFSQYYNAARSNKTRKAIVDFDWDSMLPVGVPDYSNEYESVANRELYNLIKCKKYFKIRYRFFKIKVYKKYKNFKLRIKNGK